MKKVIRICLTLFALFFLDLHYAYGQNVGINNTNPLSTFDITGSYGYGIRAVSSSATLASTDATVLASPGITLTLPASASVTRRVVLIVYNGSYGSSAVTVKPAGTDHVVSNNVSYAAASGITLSIGSIALQTDGSGNWYATMNSGAQSGNNWLLSGNAGTTASNFLGTTDNIGMGIRTNNTQRIHIDSLGRIGIGTNSIGFFDPTNPEELLVDYTGSASGTVANFTGSRNDFVQINVQNKNSGTNASSDYVATADNGTDSTYYIDMGINSSTYTPSVDNFGGPDDGYLYTYARNLVVGTDAPGSDLIFLLAGGSIKNNTAMRMVTPTRNIVIGKGEATNLPLGNVIRGPNASTSFTNIAGGSLTLQGGSSTGTTAGANVYIYGGASASGTGGSVNLNTSANFATNINTGTSTSDVTIGNSSDNIIFPKFTSAGGVFYTGAVSGQVANTGAGTSGYVLQANGAGFAPSWVTASSLATGTSWLLLGNSSITQPAAPGTYGTSTFGASENWIGNIDAKDFTIGTSNKERMRVLSTGNIGIGTATPAATLDVNGYNVSSGNTMNITSNALTTGTALNVTSTGTIITNGEVAQFTGNSASSGNIITVSGTGLTSGSAISATAGTTTGNAVGITSNGVSTGNGISLTANGLTTGHGLKISSSSALINGGDLINLTSTGNNTGNTVTGIHSTITGTNGTSIGGEFSASGATNNYGLIVPLGGGNVGFGTSTPNRELVVVNNGLNNVVTIENSNVAGYSSIDMYDNTGALASTFGYGNPSSVAPFTGKGYFNTYGNDFVWVNNVALPNPVLTISAQAATPGWIGVQTSTPGQLLEIAPTTGTIRIDGLKSGNSYNSSSTATTSTILYSNNSTGDVYALPTVNNATLMTSGTGVPSWKTGTANGIFWSLTGNSGTSASTSVIGTTANNNFTGTTDATAWVTATSGYERLRIASAGNIGIQNTAPSALLDIQSSTAANAFNVTTGNVVNIIGNALTTGTGLNVNSTANITSGGEIASFTGNSITSGNILTLSATGLTSGSAISAVAGNTTGNAIDLAVNSLTSGNGINVSSNSTAGTGSGSTALLKLTRSGANASASHTAYGVNASVTNTGTTSTNIAGQFNASGATNNYAIIVPANGGNVGIGTAAPVADAELALKDGHLQSQQSTAPVATGGGAATIGSTGTVSLSNATDIAGKITITASGSSASSSGTMITITFNKAYATAPVVVISPTSAAASAAFSNNQFFVGSTTTTFTIGNGQKIANGTYTFNYQVIETQ